MSEVWSFTGYRSTGYFKYLNADTGTTLIAEPGGQYSITATEFGLAVPPPDGNWVAVVVPEVTVKAKQEATVSVKPVAGG